LIPEEFYRATEDLHSGKIKSKDAVLEIRRDIERAVTGLSPCGIFDVISCKPCGAAAEEYEEPPALEDDFRVTLKDFSEYEAGAEDLRFFHGDASLCGLCLVWSLVRQWVRGETSLSDAPLPRRLVSVTTGALGKGVDDAFEFLFRASDGRYFADTELGAGIGAPEVMPGSGFFAFKLGLPGARPSVFALKEELVPRDYLRACREASENPGDFEKNAVRRKLQRDFARQVLAESEPFRAIA
ncbi:MAG: hypothetical protein LBS53_11235, partial [Synergistaceae bacterium]|nr:hypothetical protein [Synergistaceae bacterium]